jgi:O-acetylhomoserine/O-acetylserine sulfhydrylase-like pyridoxal-dependent enzyme
MSTGEERAAGASPEMIRLSIGIVQVGDIIADFDPALDTAT